MRVTDLGLCLVLVVTLFGAPAVPVHAVEDAPAPAGNEPSPAELQQQIRELQRRIVQLERELRTLRRAPEAASGSAHPAAPEAVLAPAKPLPQVRTPKPPAAPRMVTVSTVASPTMGTVKAPVTIVEFTDYQCPFCAQFYITMFPELKRKYIDTGKVRFVSRELPLSFHKQAYKASVAAHCAANQDQFWEMRDILFRNQRNLLPHELEAYGLTLDLDFNSFQECFADNEPRHAIAKDLADAKAVGITGTPTFVIGATLPNSTMVKGKVLVGAKPFATFAAEIDALLDADPAAAE